MAQSDSKKARDYRISNELKVRRPNLSALKKAIRKKEHEIKFSEKEIELLSKLPAEEFNNIQSVFAYERSDSYLEFFKEMKIETMKLNVVFLKEDLEVDKQSIRLEEAKISLLEKGVEIGGIKDDKILEMA